MHIWTYLTLFCASVVQAGNFVQGPGDFQAQHPLAALSSTTPEANIETIWPSTFNFAGVSNPRLGREVIAGFNDMMVLVEAALRALGGDVLVDTNPIFLKYFRQMDAVKIKSFFQSIKDEALKTPNISKFRVVRVSDVQDADCDFTTGAHMNALTEATKLSPIMTICDLGRLVFKLDADSACTDYGGIISAEMATLGGLLLHEFSHWSAWTGITKYAGFPPPLLIGDILDQPVKGAWLGKAYGPGACAALNADPRTAINTSQNADSYAWFASEYYIKSTKCPGFTFADATLGEYPFFCKYLCKAAGYCSNGWCMIL